LIDFATVFVKVSDHIGEDTFCVGSTEIFLTECALIL
jgi:hypothetical protein